MLGFNGGLMGVRRRLALGNSNSGLWFQNEQSVAKRAGIWVLPIGSYSQSSVYGSTTAVSAAIMTDGSFTNTGSATNAGANEWIKIDYGSAISINSVIIGTATNNIPGGWNKSYTENKLVQTSDNDSTWTTLFNTGTFAAEGIYTFSAPSNFTSVTARYIRLYATSYVAVSEFYAI